MRKIAIGRISGLLIAISGISVSVWLARDAMRMNSEFYEWIDARPLETAIDLSQPCEISVPFDQTCSTAHGEALYLGCDLDDKVKEDVSELLSGLSGEIVIKNSAGETVESTQLSSQSAWYWGGDIILASFDAFEKGNFSATIRIDSGAPALARKQQDIYVVYQLCGLELMPAYLSGAIAFFAGLVALVASACSIPGAIKHGLWIKP